MAAEWWYYENGENALAGVEGDPDNPPVLGDWLIINLLTTVPESRASFDRIVPNMLPDEQTRLYGLRDQGIAVDVAIDYKKASDDFQKVQNTAGVRTCGPRGGGSWFPPPMVDP